MTARSCAATCADDPTPDKTPHSPSGGWGSSVVVGRQPPLAEGRLYDEGMDDVLSWVAIFFSVVSLAWTTFITIRLNDAHFSITPGLVTEVYVDGRPHVALELTSLGANLVKDVRLTVHADPMNQALQLTERRWHSIPAQRSVRTIARGIGWYGPAAAPLNTWNMRFHGTGIKTAERLVTVSWKNALGFRRKQEIELPRLPDSPEYETDELRRINEEARAKNLEL